jgi:WD40 repeat protein
LKVWDADTADQKQSIGGFTRHVTAIEYRGATDEVVSASGDKQVRVHNAANGGLVRTIPSVEAWIHGLDVTASGEIVAAGSADGTVHVWNVTTGQVLATIPAEKAAAAVPRAR